MLALTFANVADYDKVRQDDTFDIKGLDTFAPGKNLTIICNHADGTKDSIEVKHTYNEQQIEWFHTGSALNKIRENLGMKG